MGKVVDTGDADFDVMTKSDEWVLADFWAPWSGPVSYTHLTLPTNREV